MEPTRLPSVWVVDDDEDDLVFIQAAFLGANPAISTVLISESNDLLTRLDASDNLPKLVILDVNMPRLNGMELLSKVRSRPEYALLPIIMLTTSTNPDDRQQAKMLGANDYLVKPVSLQYFRLLAQALSQQWVVS